MNTPGFAAEASLGNGMTKGGFMLSMAAARAAGVRVWQVMSWGREPDAGQPLLEGADGGC